MSHSFTIGPATFITSNALVKNPRLHPTTPDIVRGSRLGKTSGCV